MSFFSKKNKGKIVSGFILTFFMVLSVVFFKPVAVIAATFAPGATEQNATVDGTAVTLFQKKENVMKDTTSPDYGKKNYVYLYKDQQGKTYYVNSWTESGQQKYTVRNASPAEVEGFTGVQEGGTGTYSQTLYDSKGNVVTPSSVVRQPDKSEAFRCVLWDWSGGTWNACVGLAAYTFLGFCSWFVYFSAIAFNASIDYGLNMTNFINDVPIVELGWRTFRDLTSIFFVFVILYIAINTILGNSSYGIKALLGKVIVGAILINFSLFFTKVVIDASNVVALQFYAKIMQTAKDNSTDDSTDDWDSGISAQFANAMGLQTVWGTGGAGSGGTSGASQMVLNSKNLMVVGFMGGIFMLCTATIFLAGAIMFIIRSIVFVFLMTFSPLAFMAGILPSTKKYAGPWWSKLFSNAIFAPVYMVLMYTTLAMVLTPGRKNINFVDMFRGDVDFSSTVLSFIILNALMLGCLMVASKLGATGAGWATEMASKATFGTAAWAGRNTIGRAFDYAANTDALKESKTWIGRSALSLSRRVGGASFDTRGLPGGGAKKFGLGSAAAGGFTKAREDKTKAKTEFGKSLDAPGQRAYAASLGKKWRSRASNKAADEIFKTALTEEISKHNEQIKELEDDPEMKEYEQLSKKAASGKNMPQKELDRLSDLATIASSKIVKEYKVFDSTTGTWNKVKDKPYLDGGTGKSVLGDMKEARTNAQTYLRNKSWKKK